MESSKAVLINMVASLEMSTELATAGLLKLKLFSNKNIDVIASGHDVKNKFMSFKSNYIVDMVI